MKFSSCGPGLITIRIMSAYNCFGCKAGKRHWCATASPPQIMSRNRVCHPNVLVKLRFSLPHAPSTGDGTHARPYRNAPNAYISIRPSLSIVSATVEDDKFLAII